MGLALALGVAAHMLWDRSLESAEDRKERREMTGTFAKIADTCCGAASKAAEVARACIRATTDARQTEVGFSR